MENKGFGLAGKELGAKGRPGQARREQPHGKECPSNQSPAFVPRSLYRSLSSFLVFFLVLVRVLLSPFSFRLRAMPLREKEDEERIKIKIKMTKNENENEERGRETEKDPGSMLSP
ncbi:MAG: hypothetical protein LBI02_05550 [Opitutaceae bacterium]|jgi:hypothetical protein|nr:hypothetical protein [Opitutaceae bacterium]